jgi:transcription initiation factor TFIIE subunit alpha
MKHSKDVEEKVIAAIAGSDVLELVEYLRGKSNISEFIIAEGLNKEINPVRNMLYRLLDANLVTFTRKKDKQKGWYIYYWTYDNSNINHLFWEAKRKRLEFLQENITKEKNTVFFICPSGCIRTDFDRAFEFDYRCPECGEIIIQQDTTEKIKTYQSELTDLEIEMSEREVLKSMHIAPEAKKTKAKVAVEKIVKEKKAVQVKEVSKPLVQKSKITNTKTVIKSKSQKAISITSEKKQSGTKNKPSQVKQIQTKQVKEKQIKESKAAIASKDSLKKNGIKKNTLEKIKQTAAKFATASFF